MNKETTVLLVWMLICYLLVAFVTLVFNPLAWHWLGRLGLLILWFWGVAYFEKNK
jgi:hypothetical protein